MRATPIQTGTTTVLATACGLLSAWYVPALIPSIAVAVLWYLAVICAAAKILHLAPGQFLADVTRLWIRATATAITLGAGLALNWLARFDHVVATAEQTSTANRTVRSTAA